MDEKMVEVANMLGTVLADTFMLYLKTHQFHWNVEGPLFPMLHKLFGKQYTALWETTDRIAERIRALNYPAPMGFNVFAQMTTLPDVPAAPSAIGMVNALLADHERCAQACANGFRLATEAGDDTTANLLLELVEAHQKDAWMLRSTAKVCKGTPPVRG